MADLSEIILAIKAQSAFGTPAAGSGATGIEVAASQGMALQIASIESAMVQRSRMRKRPRQGTRTANASYETELQVSNLDPVIEGVLGGTWTAGDAYDETDWGGLTITGTGTTLTFAGGTLLVDGIVAGMMARLAGMSVAANDNKWFPVLNVTAGVITTVAGILADNASDAGWDIEFAPSVYTATPYVNRYFTIEAYMPAPIDRSKIGTDMRLNNFNLNSQPDSPLKIGFGFGGRALELLDEADSPNFSSPTFVDGPSLVLLDGGIYINGVKRTNITGFQVGLQAPVSSTPVIGSTTPPDVNLGQFTLSGNFTGVVENGTDWDAMTDEDQISVLLHCREQGDATSDFVSFYMGNMSFGGWATPEGGEGAVIQTIPLYGGEDERGAGFAPTAVLVSAFRTE